MKQYQGYFWGASGQVTDDTEMTMNLAMTLLKCGGVYNPVAALTSYLDWANGGCCFLGKNTRFLLKTPNKNRLAYYNRQIALQKKQPEASWPQSNGALMRCSPLAVISDDKARDEAVFEDCRLTNFHPTAIACNRLYVEIVRLLLRAVAEKVKTNVSVGTFICCANDTP